MARLSRFAPAAATVVLLVASFGSSYFRARPAAWLEVAGSGEHASDGVYPASRLGLFQHKAQALAARSPSTSFEIGCVGGIWKLSRDDAAVVAEAVRVSSCGVVPPRTGWSVVGLTVNARGHLRAEKPRGSPRSLRIDLTERPWTCTVILLCCAVYACLICRGASADTVALNYDKVIEARERWRLVTSTLSHVSLVHLVINLSSAYNLGVLEQWLGSSSYFQLIVQLCVLVPLAKMSAMHLAVAHLGQQWPHTTYSLGYSGVLFGLTVVVCLQLDRYCLVPGLDSWCFETHRFNVGGAALPFNLAPFVMLVGIHLIVPNVSFTGHLAGIVCGFPAAWGCLRRLVSPLMCNLATLALLWASRGEPEGSARATRPVRQRLLVASAILQSFAAAMTSVLETLPLSVGSWCGVAATCWACTRMTKDGAIEAPLETCAALYVARCAEAAHYTARAGALWGEHGFHEGAVRAAAGVAVLWAILALLQSWLLVGRDSGRTIVRAGVVMIATN